jgi:hypothetical protein
MGTIGDAILSGLSDLACQVLWVKVGHFRGESVHPVVHYV